MEDPVHSPRLVRFGTFEVDLPAGELRKGGVKVKLTGQPFQVLTILLEHPGEVVTREELQKRLWPDTFVDVDHNLNTAINKIREVLGDSAESPRFVETLPRRGYRFVAPVEDAQTTTVPGGSNVRQESPLSSVRRETTSFPVQANRPWLAWSAVAMVLVTGAALSLIHLRESPLVPAPVQFQIFPSGSLPQGDSFAVSPDGRHLAFAATGSDGEHTCGSAT